MPGPPIAHSAAGPSELLSPNRRDFTECVALCERLDLMPQYPPLSLTHNAALALGLPLRTIVPIGALRAVRTALSDPDHLAIAVEDKEAKRWDPSIPQDSLLFRKNAIEQGVLMRELPLPLFAHDFVMAHYLRSQTVGAGLGPYGAVPPHAFIAQHVDFEGPGSARDAKARFSEKFVGWLPERRGAECGLRSWALKPLLARARSPWLDLETRLACWPAIHVIRLAKGENNEVEVRATDALGVSSTEKESVQAASTALFIGEDAVAANERTVLNMEGRGLQVAAVATDAASKKVRPQEISVVCNAMFPSPFTASSQIEHLARVLGIVDAETSAAGAARRTEALQASASRTEYVLQQVCQRVPA